MTSSAKLRITSVVHIGVSEGFGQLRYAAEVSVIADSLAGQNAMESMVEIVIPLGVEAEAPGVN
jgi:hypothetical protein